MKVALLFLFVALAFSLNLNQSQSWGIVYPHDGTIAIATSFYGAESGYVAGGSASGRAIFDLTEDGGNTFTNEDLSGPFGQTGSFLSVRMGSPTWGIAGALGFVGLPCGAVTNDGVSWVATNQTSLCAFQGAAVVDDEQTGVLIGMFLDRQHPSGNVIQMTTDGGKTWTTQDAQNVGDIPVRYGSFLSKDLGYVTSGIWPETAEEKTSKRIHRLSQHLSYDFLTQTISYVPTAVRNPLKGYSAILSKVENEGTQWTTMLNQTDFGLYFNEIVCTDEMNCWSVLEGQDNTGAQVGKVYHTNNGWNTFDVQFTLENGGMESIDMYNSTYGWAAGTLYSGPGVTGDFDAMYYRTIDGGENWVFDSSIKNFAPMDLSVPTPENAYSAGITPGGVSSFAAWN